MDHLPKSQTLSYHKVRLSYMYVLHPGSHSFCNISYHKVFIQIWNYSLSLASSSYLYPKILIPLFLNTFDKFLYFLFFSEVLEACVYRQLSQFVYQ